MSKVLTQKAKWPDAVDYVLRNDGATIRSVQTGSQYSSVNGLLVSADSFEMAEIDESVLEQEWILE